MTDLNGSRHYRGDTIPIELNISTTDSISLLGARVKFAAATASNHENIFVSLDTASSTLTIDPSSTADALLVTGKILPNATTSLGGGDFQPFTEKCIYDVEITTSDGNVFSESGTFDVLPDLIR
jgi:hypothetical protein